VAAKVWVLAVKVHLFCQYIDGIPAGE